jgi:hypothetical protein
MNGSYPRIVVTLESVYLHRNFPELRLKKVVISSIKFIGLNLEKSRNAS